jgi:hypothetical protein
MLKLPVVGAELVIVTLIGFTFICQLPHIDVSLSMAKKLSVTASFPPVFDKAVAAIWPENTPVDSFTGIEAIKVVPLYTSI